MASYHLRAQGILASLRHEFVDFRVRSKLLLTSSELEVFATSPFMSARSFYYYRLAAAVYMGCVVVASLFFALLGIDGTIELYLIYYTRWSLLLVEVYLVLACLATRRQAKFLGELPGSGPNFAPSPSFHALSLGWTSNGDRGGGGGGGGEGEGGGGSALEDVLMSGDFGRSGRSGSANFSTDCLSNSPPGTPQDDSPNDSPNDSPATPDRVRSRSNSANFSSQALSELNYSSGRMFEARLDQEALRNLARLDDRVAEREKQGNLRGLAAPLASEKTLGTSIRALGRREALKVVAMVDPKAHLRPDRLIRATWLIQNMIYPNTLLVTGVFWLIIYPGVTIGANSPDGATDDLTHGRRLDGGYTPMKFAIVTQEHGMNFVVMALDVFLSNAPFRMAHIHHVTWHHQS